MAEVVEPQVSRYQEYKPTGVEWMPEIPAGWEVNRLRNICRLQGRVGFKGYQVSDLVGLGEGALTIGGKHIRHNVVDVSDPDYISWEKYYESPEIMIETGDIIVAQRGTLGKVAHLIEDIGPATINPSLIILKDISVFSRFLYWYLRSNYVLKVIDMLNTSTAVPMLSQAQFSEFKVLIPSDSEQRAIARFLDDKTAQLDQLITQKQQMLALLWEERAALINHAVTKGLDPQAPLRDSGVEWLGEVPAHWEVKRLKHLTVKIGSGITPKGGAEVYQKSGVPILRSQNIHFDGLRLDDVAFIEEEVHQSMNNSQVLPGDVLLNITGASIGRCYFADETLGEANVNQHVCIVRPNEAILTKFLWAVLSAELGQEQIQISQNGSGREGLNFENLKKFVIGVPSLQEQQEIMSFVAKEEDKIVETTDTINQEIALLQEYRAALIAEAVTGQLDVRHYVPVPAAVLM